MRFFIDKVIIILLALYSVTVFSAPSVINSDGAKNNTTKALNKARKELPPYVLPPLPTHQECVAYIHSNRYSDNDEYFDINCQFLYLKRLKKQFEASVQYVAKFALTAVDENGKVISKTKDICDMNTYQESAYKAFLGMIKAWESYVSALGYFSNVAGSQSGEGGGAGNQVSTEIQVYTDKLETLKSYETSLPLYCGP